MDTIKNITADELDGYDSDRYDCRPNANGTFDLVPLLWFDDASYAEYQGMD